ncbi:MAG: Fe-S cluster assembly ATPase SufC [Acidimicrobiia bacterium]|jgi:Fe-S cluster assembly ATP-binding protein|nr:Fe-S cluster assembly ATPase SufC [Acidimicrobiia bacterium]MBP8181456.1 Fe-S cluster assembly ATPase SufC [Acidimicrobiia bacterium]
MAVLTIDELTASVRGTEILKGVSLEIRSGEVDVLMGPNGSGKSTLAHVLMGNPAYEVTGGSVSLDGTDVLALQPSERAQLGLFGAMQYPNELPGITLSELLAGVYQERGWDAAGLDDAVRSEADAVNLRSDLLNRSLNVGFSGGEKKRAETIQLVLSRPRIAILDEIDSGLDVDALHDVSTRIEGLTNSDADSEPLGVLAITHYTRLLNELRGDRVHVFVKGRIVRTGGPELADELEDVGYEAFA